MSNHGLAHTIAIAMKRRIGYRDARRARSPARECESREFAYESSSNSAAFHFHILARFAIVAEVPRCRSCCNSRDSRAIDDISRYPRYQRKLNQVSRESVRSEKSLRLRESASTLREQRREINLISCVCTYVCMCVHVGMRGACSLTAHESEETPTTTLPPPFRDLYFCNRVQQPRPNVLFFFFF